MSPTTNLELVLVLLKLNIANVTPSVKVNTPIIRIDKNSYKYEDLFLSDFIPGQAQLLDFYTGYF